MTDQPDAGARSAVAELDAEVIIVGAGPVGMSAAMDLDARGLKTIVIESRGHLEAPNVKCNHVASRTMERFARFGVADAIRNAGLPRDYPHDVAFRTALTGVEFGRIPIPSPAERAGVPSGPDAQWATPEPPHRINQRYLEPILMAHLTGRENVTLLNRHRYLDFEQDDSSVAVRTRDPQGQEVTLRARFLIGADGSRSLVRKQIQAAFVGDPVLQRVQSTCIRAPRLYEIMPGRRAWGYYTFSRLRSGHVYAIDGEELFLVHTYLDEGETEQSVDRTSAIRTILGVDDDFEIEVISKEDWVARRLVADRFRDRRVFIAGDAAHIWVPYAGFGMNAGIADVLNLTWCLGARLQGWGGEAILEVYEAERLPVTQQVSDFVMMHQRKIAQSDVPEDLADDSVAGEESRRRFGAAAYALNVEQFAAEGLNFGYSYSDSPVIAYDGEKPPEFSMGRYTPSIVPGCRAPHFWFPNGRSLYSALGPGYTLIRIGDRTGAESIVRAAESAGVPLTVLDVERSWVPPHYDRPFLLVREDQHVVWRGDEAPEDAGALLDRLRGWAPGPAGRSTVAEDATSCEETCG